MERKDDMKREPEKYNGIPIEIAESIRNVKSLSFTLEKGDKIYERIFTPMGASYDRAIVSYNHKKNTYQVFNTPSGNIYKLIDRKEMPAASTINHRIHGTIKVLLESGYVFASSNNTKLGGV